MRIFTVSEIADLLQRDVETIAERNDLPLERVAVQIVRESTFSRVDRQLEDEATVAWKLCNGVFTSRSTGLGA